MLESVLRGRLLGHPWPPASARLRSTSRRSRNELAGYGLMAASPLSSSLLTRQVDRQARLMSKVRVVSIRRHDRYTASLPWSGEQKHLAQPGPGPRLGHFWAGRTQAGRDFPVAQPAAGRPVCQWPSLCSPSPPLAQPALAQPPQAARPAGWAGTGWASCGLGEHRLGHLQAGPLLGCGATAGWATSGLGQMLLPADRPRCPLPAYMP